jgi:hypothetical protein
MVGYGDVQWGLMRWDGVWCGMVRYGESRALKLCSLIFTERKMKEKELTFVGIDPGINGSVAVSLPDGCIKTFIMPTITKKLKDKRKKVIDHVGLRDFFKSLKTNHEQFYVVVEKQQAMSKQGVKQGVSAMVTLGIGYGALLQVLTDFEIPFEVVRAQEWQKEFGIANGDTKVQALEVCQGLFPNLNLLATKKSRVPHKGIVDAVLIMQYGIRKHKDEI